MSIATAKIRSWEKTAEEVSMIVTITLPRNGPTDTANAMIGEQVGDIKNMVLDGKLKDIEGHAVDKKKSRGLATLGIFSIILVSFLWNTGTYLADWVLGDIFYPPFNVEETCGKIEKYQQKEGTFL